MYVRSVLICDSSRMHAQLRDNRADFSFRPYCHFYPVSPEKEEAREDPPLHEPFQYCSSPHGVPSQTDPDRAGPGGGHSIERTDPGQRMAHTSMFARNSDL